MVVPASTTESRTTELLLEHLVELGVTGRLELVLVDRGTTARAMSRRFNLEVNREQHQRLLARAGAARRAYNHHLARGKANLDQRVAERSYGIEEADLTPPVSWSKVSFIKTT